MWRHVSASVREALYTQLYCESMYAARDSYILLYTHIYVTGALYTHLYCESMYTAREATQITGLSGARSGTSLTLLLVAF